MSRRAQKMRAFMTMAEVIAGLSTCRRRAVGALLIAPDFSEVLAIGYNGPPAGVDHDRCTGERRTCGCIHAEANVLVKARRHADRDLILLVTRQPCVGCAGLIVNSRCVSLVVWGEPSSAGAEGLALLYLAGVAHAGIEEYDTD